METQRFKYSRPLRIAYQFARRRVRGAVDFNDQLGADGHEIDDVAIDRTLTAEFNAYQAAIPQRTPKYGFGVCLLRPKLTRFLLGTTQH